MTVGQNGQKRSTNHMLTRDDECMGGWSPYTLDACCFMFRRAVDYHFSGVSGREEIMLSVLLSVFGLDCRICYGLILLYRVSLSESTLLYRSKIERPSQMALLIPNILFSLRDSPNRDRHRYFHCGLGSRVPYHTTSYGPSRPIRSRANP